MPQPSGFYSVSDYGDDLREGERLRIERYINLTNKADISQLATFPVETLKAMREGSVMQEKAEFSKLRKATAAWELQASNTLLIDAALEYARVKPVEHTANEWVCRQSDPDIYNMSNSVYMFSAYVTISTKYNHETGEQEPFKWTLSWNLYTNSPTKNTHNIAGQNNKVFTSPEALDKYLAGRRAAYAGYFEEISPPIPREYADDFKVHGLLLPGYRVEGEDRAVEQPSLLNQLKATVPQTPKQDKQRAEAPSRDTER